MPYNQPSEQDVNDAIKYKFHIIWALIFKGSITYIFPCGRWLARDEDDTAISRELVAERAIQEVTKDGQVKAKELRLKDKLESRLQ